MRIYIKGCLWCKYVKSDCGHAISVNHFAEYQLNGWKLSHNCPYFKNRFQVGNKVEIRFIVFEECEECEDYTAGVIVDIVNKKLYFVEVDEDTIPGYKKELVYDSVSIDLHNEIKKQGKKYVIAKYDYLEKIKE